MAEPSPIFDDPATFSIIVREHGATLMALTRRYLPREEAADALQEAWLAAYRGASSFGGRARPTTWLYRIVVNTCLMRLRSMRRHPEVPFEGSRPARAASASVPRAAWADAELVRRERRRHVRRVVGRLPNRLREVLVLRDLEEHDTAETARILGVGENIVRVRLHRARRRLRVLLGDGGALRSRGGRPDAP